MRVKIGRKWEDLGPRSQHGDEPNHPWGQLQLRDGEWVGSIDSTIITYAPKRTAAIDRPRPAVVS